MYPGDTEVTDQVGAACPIRDLLDRIGGRWSVRVIEELAGRTRRFTELERAIEGISRRMLARTLRALERDGLLARTVYPTVPATVEYALTPLALGLAALLAALADWARNHRSDVLAARERYDTEHGAPAGASTGAPESR
ncbi:hypothetical protein BIV57_00675 [Mangrovactinospora gilvigrisea]|uniref:HTH hxlR-type domain-containing protein n=1 Tax=Mangrovactinospora gilvigrisea TaxID=1428644 RepID=A0A1J7BL26_9ACTN|nr:helix-turn-helix domain-containing protein [Mangrovactinospora gilvigrisea]OIV39391.1 hypothetical protein BIV57_00675 [Mangrovactinospora gilvigrisea]